MEEGLDKALKEVISGQNIEGCLFADKQGLCLEAVGEASASLSGIAVAISEQACNLEPNSNPPVLVLENKKKLCLIHKYGDITGVIYKKI